MRARERADAAEGAGVAQAAQALSARAAQTQQQAGVVRGPGQEGLGDAQQAGQSCGNAAVAARGECGRARSDQAAAGHGLQRVRDLLQQAPQVSAETGLVRDDTEAVRRRTEDCLREAEGLKEQTERDWR